MTTERFSCSNDRRRAAIIGHPTLNAIDYLEIADLAVAELDAAEQTEFALLPAGPGRDRLLWHRRIGLHFINPLTPEQLAGLSATAIRITGGERVRSIRVEALATGAQELILRASEAGDFSRYTLALVRSGSDPRPPAGFDPVLSLVAFSFRVDCPSEFDCRQGHVCLGAPSEEPQIDYLAKDFASFRRVILDRLALLMPEWKDRSPADLAITLVELIAYVGDQLSYRQDAVATEAYLETARRRTSVRRHALLVDYPMHDGCNARTWLHVRVGADTTIAPESFPCATAVPGLPPRVMPGGRDERNVREADAEWFEPVDPELERDGPAPGIPLFVKHNELRFYAWGDDQCCLLPGATGATLAGHHPDLHAGDVLVLEEVRGPVSGAAADADRRHRHAVRLTGVGHSDENGPLTDPLDGSPITTIDWAGADKLPFKLCISSRPDAAGTPIADVSVARGNMVLVDHGRTLIEPLGLVHPGPRRFRPSLGASPLTATPTAPAGTPPTNGSPRRRLRFDPLAPAASATGGTPDHARPSIVLTSVLDGDTTTWQATRDLLDSAADAPDFVIEAEADGTTGLRFGTGDHGRPPRLDEVFTASYRVGNGIAGNVGADAIRHVVSADARILNVRNPLPAVGGTDAETIAEVRRRAPEAFRTQERAVTPADYEAVTMRYPGLQRAAATMRWTGSWHTVFLTVDRTGSHPFDSDFETELATHVERFRMAGHDIEFDEPRFVSLEVELEICARPDYFRSDVTARLLEVLSNRTFPDGGHGIFHPDSFSFGQPVYLSPILAAARNVPGVDSARVVTFQRQGTRQTQPLADGQLRLSRLEIARLDNDPDFPERGVLRIFLSGGK